MTQGEYAAISTNPNDIFGSPADGRLTFPTMQSLSLYLVTDVSLTRYKGSTGEAAFMTGLERNSDIVYVSCALHLWAHLHLC